MEDPESLLLSMLKMERLTNPWWTRHGERRPPIETQLRQREQVDTPEVTARRRRLMAEDFARLSRKGKG